MPESPRRDDESPPDRNLPVPFGWVRMYVAVLECLGYLALCGFLGYWLDQRRGWSPWGLLLGLMLGTAFGLYRLLHESKRIGL